MKISVCSDIHLEFGDIDLVNTDSADVLILGGDICVAADISQRDPYNTMGEHYRSNRYHDFFQRCSAQFPHVIFIVGNHEHYHGDFATTYSRIQSMLESNMLSNVHLLDNEVRVINNVTFIGGTLWTDMNDRDPLTLYHMQTMMNDFRIIKNSHRRVGLSDRPARFLPEDAVEEFDKFYGYIRTVVSERPNDRFVVVGHHSPSRLSTHAQYVNDTIMNGGYSSNLDEFIEAHPQIRLWTHGHTHHEFDYVIGKTRVMCNPRGYIGHEAQADQWQLKTVTI